MGYTKLFNEIIMSTVWREPDHVRILWITMLALKDQHHTVSASLPGLADAARISMKECEEALGILKAPDPHSRTKEYEGRRIEECDGGWYILNGEKYKKKMSADERREYKAQKQREYRQRDKEEKERQERGQVSGQKCTKRTHTDTDTDTNTDQIKTITIPDGLNEKAWNDYIEHRKTNKNKKLKDKSIEKLMKWLVEQGDHDIQAAIVDTTIRNGWTGLFELKGVQNGKGNQRSESNAGKVNDAINDLFTEAINKGETI